MHICHKLKELTVFSLFGYFLSSYMFFVGRDTKMTRYQRYKGRSQRKFLPDGKFLL